MEYTVFLVSSSEGGFITKCLELPVTSQGSTKEDAVNNIKEAIAGYLEVKASINQENYTNLEIVVKVVNEALIADVFPSASNYTIEDFRRGVALLKDKLKAGKTDS